jgi:hypothetical protein
VDAGTARPSAGLRRPHGIAQARECGALGGGAVMLSPVRNPGEGGANGSIVAEMRLRPQFFTNFNGACDARSRGLAEREGATYKV